MTAPQILLRITLFLTLPFINGYSVAAALIFCADCSAPNSVGAWSLRHQWQDGRLQRELTGNGSYQESVIRVEVFPGDNVGGWGGERSEVAVMLSDHGEELDVNETTPPEYYALSIMLPTDWQPPQRDAHGHQWGTFFQLHGPDHYNAPPSVALMVEDRFYINTYSGDIQMRSGGSTSFEFTDGSLRKGEWTQFMLDIVWSASDRGSVTIYRRDQCSESWKLVFQQSEIATLQYHGNDAVGDHYWKAGYYRSGGATISKLWLGPIARGSRWRDVERAAFGMQCGTAAERRK